MPLPAQPPAMPRITYLRIKNYRTLRDVAFHGLTPLTVLIGPNGSGKSTVLDALDFLAEAVRGNLVGAWEKRNRFAGMRTRGSERDIEFELLLTGSPAFPQLHYALSLREVEDRIIVISEKLVEYETPTGVRLAYILSKSEGWHTHFGIFKLGENQKIPEHSFGEELESLFDGNAGAIHSSTVESLSSWFEPFKKQAEYFIAAISSYRNVILTKDHLKGISDAGPRERLSPNGDNLPNVLYHLYLKHPEALATITARLRKWVPKLADVVPEITSDERILLRFKDAQFEKPLPAQYMSGGTMRLMALLTLLHEPDTAGLLGIEEPENELHPQLLYRLAEEFEKAAEQRQLFVTTHSPLLLDALAPEQVWVMYRGRDGYSHTVRTADMPNVPELVEDGSMLGYLWTSNTFTEGDPLAPFKPSPDAR